MKLLSSEKLSLLARLFSRGSIGVLFMSACIAQAADPTYPEPTQKGAGASSLQDKDKDYLQPTGASVDTKSFLKEAYAGNAAEVKLAEVAETKSDNAQVKQFASTLKQDHQQANEKLQPIAQAHGVTVSDTLDPKDQKAVDRLQKLSGSDFDKEYTKAMLKDHKKDIGEYEKAAAQIKEADVKQYAQDTLPTLQEHLKDGQQAAQAAGVDPATISSILKEKSPGGMGGTGDESEHQSGTDSQPQPQPQTPRSY